MLIGKQMLQTENFSALGIFLMCEELVQVIYEIDTL